MWKANEHDLQTVVCPYLCEVPRGYGNTPYIDCMTHYIIYTVYNVYVYMYYMYTKCICMHTCTINVLHFAWINPSYESTIYGYIIYIILYNHKIICKNTAHHITEYKNSIELPILMGVCSGHIVQVDAEKPWLTDDRWPMMVSSVFWTPQTYYWLVVSSIFKHIKVSWEGLSHILWKIKNVPNHQSDNNEYISWVGYATYSSISCDMSSHIRSTPTKRRSTPWWRLVPCDRIGYASWLG